MRAQTYTLLDAAALASTAELNFADAARAPDFVAVSFYKIFGFPNLGGLLVKKSARTVMESRRYFAGGTVEMVVAVNESWVYHKDASLHSRLEDGTLPFVNIFALDLAIDTHRTLYGAAPMKYISMHTTRLVKKLYDGLVALKHSNGVPVVKIYKDRTSVYGEAHLQGPTIAFNVQKDRGGVVEFMDFEREADKQNIYVRSGSLCNPGGMATYLEWSPQELWQAFDHGHKCSDPQPEYMGKPLGVVRASLGAMSNDADVERLLQFVRETYVDRPYETGGPISLPPEMTQEAPKDICTVAVLHVSEEKQVFSRLSYEGTISHAFRRQSILKTEGPKRPTSTVHELDGQSFGPVKRPSVKSDGRGLWRIRRGIMGAMGGKGG